MRCFYARISLNLQVSKNLIPSEVVVLLRTSHLHLQWRTKVFGTVTEDIAFTSLTYQMIGCSIICTSLTLLIPRNGPPLPPPNNIGMKKRFRDRLKCAGLHKLQHCLGRGKGAERKRHHANCPKTFVPHCSCHFELILYRC